MVEITIVIEGGIVNTDTADTQTVDNSQALRQSINRIFSELLNENVSIIIQMGAGYRNAALQFVNINKKNLYLFVDLDDKKENIPVWFSKLTTENPNNPIIISDEKQQNVFFMIQEMEAWILKQSDSIDKWASENGFIRSHKSDLISDHSLIRGKNIEELNKPSSILKNLIKHFFYKEFNGKKKKLQYVKLKYAPGLLDQIDIKILFKNDSELQRFHEVIKA